jgi:hypothetical protein
MTTRKKMNKIEVRFKGKTYESSYKVAQGMATVRSICGEESVQVGGMTEEWAAKEALTALLSKAEANGCLDMWPARKS